MNEYKVSVIVPVYNDELYLSNCLESLINQSLKDIEIICINDGSSDNSLSILEDYSDKDDRISYYSQANKGPGAARNKGIEKAKGDYIAFVDADDWLDLNALEKLYNQSIKNDSDMVLFNAIEHFPNKNNERIYPVSDDEDIDYSDFSFNYKYNKKLVMNSYLIVCTKLHKHSFIVENNLKFTDKGYFEDVFFHIKSMIVAQRISYLPECLYHYRREYNKSRQVHSRNTEASFMIFNLFDEIANLLEEQNITETLRINFIQFKITELENIYSYIDETIKEDLFNRIHDEFVEMNLSDEDLDQLPSSNIIFYKDVYSSDTLSRYNLKLVTHSFKNTLKYLISKLSFNSSVFDEKQVIYENDILSGIFNTFTEDNLNYDELLDLISEKWFRNYYNNIDQSYNASLSQLVKRNVYDLAIMDDESKLKYENVVYKTMIDDVIESDVNIKGYYSILKHGLFDEEYYRTVYNYNLDIPPLLHYIYIGYLEGKDPGAEFDADFYQLVNKNARKSKLNPLVYFELIGTKEGIIKINDTLWQPSAINRIELRDTVMNFNGIGIEEDNKRDMRIIVSLTSYPKRMDDVCYTLYSLLNQNLKPDKIVLWLSEKAYSEGIPSVPDKVLKFRQNGVTIKFCEDIKSYKKLIPALREYSDDIIVTADDDIYYPPEWLESLYFSHKKYPRDVMTHRARKIICEDGIISKYEEWPLIKQEEESSYFNFFTSGGGVLFPPNSLDSRIMNMELAEAICPFADDLWFWAMTVLNKTKIHVVGNNIHRITYVNPARDIVFNKDTLWCYNQEHNDEQLDKVLEMFPEIREILEDNKERE
ncbi:MAG: glycosyltransferase [Methanobacteriaceae archaeon]|nr:glycosyltransferase [Methanobacteriaceae archaeon]